MEFVVRGRIVVQKKHILELGNVAADVADDIGDLLGNKVTLQLVSTELDPETGDCKQSPEVAVSDWFLSKDGFVPDDVQYEIIFQLHTSFGIPGAFAIRNHHKHEFYLKYVKLELPDATALHFPCNSWVFNASKYKNDRVFFSNEVYLPSDTPPGLTELRERELRDLRGDGTGERHESDRIYDYDLYNDLGNPEKGPDMIRPVLGGSREHPYPRRCRTGRSPAISDPSAESMPAQRKDFYVPSDDRPSRRKQCALFEEKLKAAAHSLLPVLKSVFGRSFKSFEEVMQLYHQNMSVEASTTADDEEKHSPHTVLVQNDFKDCKNTSWLRYPIPQIVATDEWAWSSDLEFARQTIAGVHALKITCMKAFIPESRLDPSRYGAPSSLKPEHIEEQLEGLSVQAALRGRKLLSVDYYDTFMPFLSRINAQEGIQSYASRSIFFLTKQGFLKPVAIELSLPPQTPDTSSHRVFVPPLSAEKKDWLWDLAKAHAACNDATYHQVVSHWTYTHAVLEPFILAARRHLSTMHPLHLLLDPHFKDTLAMNALARKTLTSAGGVIEKSFSPGKYSFEMSSAAYDSWSFDDQSLPADLIKRGMAVPDEKEKHGLKLTIEDYPYAIDGLEIWSAIRRWVHEFINIFYKSDAALQADNELQKWWSEVRSTGHGDKSHEKWISGVDSKANLENLLTTLIWTASGRHAAVNYGQYAYQGFLPNHPSKTHRLIPQEGTKEHAEMRENPERFFLSVIPTKAETAMLLTTLEVLSTHPEEEEYLGQRPGDEHWTSNPEILAAFHAFSRSIAEIESGIEQRNSDPQLKNRRGPANVPYTLLCPRSGAGITGRGIPNSITI
ncbi:lipoxygenase [Selaginella moellendorffii]|uniref:Lipoxygenase n=1 Tax=Selaginella moellendorffii TaxID=88036 RepID=D8R7D5_SELML|nr:lipoxygenase [Selaginella moellendorffii]